MQYFAGLFDAEGYISLCHNGSFTIAIEMASESIPNLFKETFQGSIYCRTREKRKKTWAWRINSISSQALHFINLISPYSIVKKSQLQRLKDYLDQPRKNRKSTRDITVKTIKAFKQPTLELHHILPRAEKQPDIDFFKWMAGFFDGDGNITCYYTKQGNFQVFTRQISASNIFLEAISYINDRIPGSIIKCNRPKNTMFKWVPNRGYERSICENILPFLKIKKLQCELFLEFLNFPKKKKGIPVDQNDRRFEIINQIKHLNSL